MKTHLEFARDFEVAGNEEMSKYHLEKAASEYEMKTDAECGFFCTIIEDLLGLGSDSNSGGSCTYPITNPPSAPRC